MNDSADAVKYYAIISEGRSRENPSGLLRRRFLTDGRLDEALRRDMSWEPTGLMVKWELGELGTDFVEISAEEANHLIERFRDKWSTSGQ